MMTAVSELYELCQKTRLSRPVFNFVTKYRCTVTVKEIGKAEGYGSDEKTSKKDAAFNLLQTESAQKYKHLCENQYAWANVDSKQKYVVAKLLSSRAEAVASLLLNSESPELRSRCDDICKKLGVLYCDFQ